jgi:hypothetical protein
MAPTVAALLRRRALFLHANRLLHEAADNALHVSNHSESIGRRPVKRFEAAGVPR